MRVAFTLMASLACLFLSHASIQAQTWTGTGAPTSQRYDDIYFLNADTGWAISPYVDFFNELGWIVQTTDGGNSWNVLLDSARDTYRCMAFFDDSHGFIGNLETGQTPNDTAMMLETFDGGVTWNEVGGLPGPRPSGVCGMHIHNDSLMYASGRYYGPAGMFKTTDEGTSWSYTGLDSLAGGLVDTYFWSSDSGIVVGSSGVDIFDSSGVILRTYDGGQSWERAFVTTYDEAICWKISFPSRSIGYVSVQSFNNANPKSLIRTTDGGATWFETPYFTGSSYNAQGIGFLNDTLGWIGGNYAGTGNFISSNSGQTWSGESWGQRVNRFRFPTDSIGYAAGRDIYKLSLLVSQDDPLPERLVVGPVIPNPLSQTAVVNLDVPQHMTVNLSIYSALGALIWQGQPVDVPAGNQRLPIPAFEGSPGVYFMVVESGDWSKTLRLMKL